jgi:chromosome segregation protein
VAEDRYRLEPLRDVRALAEKTGRGELAAANGDAAEAERRVAAARTATDAARAALTAALTARDATTTAAQRVLADRFVARRRRELADARARELDADAARDAHQGTVDGARRALARARADRELIERHFERWRESRAKLTERRED